MKPTVDQFITLKMKAQKTDISDKIVCLTAYSTPLARIIAPHSDIILVGDSLGMVCYGMDTTLTVTLDMMTAHGKAVRRGAPDTFIVVDMPYGTYEESPDQALANAQHIIDQTECDAVKLEGGTRMAQTIKHLTDNAIPVMAHIGLQPQSVEKEGGYKVKGKTDDSVNALMDDARAIEDAGSFCVVIEGVIEPVAMHLTRSLTIPTIGIGASAACDGQVLVTDDMIGLNGNNVPKFVKRYAALNNTIGKAAAQFRQDVVNGDFPNSDFVYTLKQ